MARGTTKARPAARGPVVVLLANSGLPAEHSSDAGAADASVVARAVVNSGTAEEAERSPGDLCGFRAYVGVACLDVLGVAR